MKGTMESETKHHEKKKTKSKGEKKCYAFCHMTTPCSIGGQAL